MTTDHQLIDITDNKIPESNGHVEKALREFNEKPTDGSLRENATRSIERHIELLKKANNMVCDAITAQQIGLL
ncbi:MAG: hypothetical protein ACYDCX_12025 [Acidithiobacillus sp.]